MDSDEDLLLSSDDEKTPQIKKKKASAIVERDELSTQEMTPIEREKLKTIQNNPTPPLHNDPSYLKIQIDNLFSIVKEQNKTIDNLKKRIETLEEQNNQPSTPILPNKTKSNPKQNDSSSSKILRKSSSGDKKRKFDKK